jgi:hypothetical protein
MPETIDIVAAAEPVIEVVAEHAVIGANATVQSSNPRLTGVDALYSEEVAPGEIHTLPKAKVILRDGSEVEREYRPGTTSAIHTEAANAHVRVMNSDESYDEDVNPDDGDHQVPDVRLIITDSIGTELATAYVPSATTDRAEALPDVTHTDSDGSPAIRRMGQSMTCTPAQPVTTRSAASTPLYTQSTAAGGTLTLPQVRILDRFGNTSDREYRPAATSNVWAESDIATYDRIANTSLISAFGCRALVSGYAGNVLRFRKSTGGTEYDVAQDALGYPDTATALTNVGTDAAFVVKLYDQSGNSRDAYWTSSTAPQPRLTLPLGTSRRCVEAAFITNQYLQCDSPVTAGQTNTIYVALTPIEMAGAIVLCGGTGSTFKWWINTDASNRLYLYDGATQNPVTPNYSISHRGPMLLAVQFKTNSLRVYVNGALAFSHNTWSVLASSMFQICRRVDGGGSIGQINLRGMAHIAADYDSSVNSKLMSMLL